MKFGVRAWSWLLGTLIASPALAAAPVSALKAEARDGQVFITWNEAESAAGTTFNVYVAEHPITNVGSARRIGHHLEAHSARDWWEDPASFTKGTPHAKPVGFLIRSGGQRLDPAGGLFVHTPAAAANKLYFVVTCSDASGNEDASIIAGQNSLAQPVTADHSAVQPIWQGSGSPPPAGAGKGKPLWLDLHAKGGVVKNMEYLHFGDASMGWRESLPFKFSVRIEGDTVVVRPTDRVWINRPHDEARDGGMPAIWTFWYGYNSNIFDRKLMEKGVPTNYTERHNLWLLNWVQQQYQPEPGRWYCSGSSMGGCGTISFGLHHPELFAGLHANVPIVAYTYLGTSSAIRLEPSCWIGKIPDDLRTDDGVSLLERMNSTRFVEKAKTDLPPLYMIHGRRDGSIPWQNNPAFYKALAEAHQPFYVYWDTGDHATCGKDAPADIKQWRTAFKKFRRDQSHPAFSNTSSDKNPGEGRPEDGDPIGWINRGMDYGDIEDAPDHYAITIKADYPGLAYPVRTDVTLRRLQQFKPRAGDGIMLQVGSDSPRAMTIGSDGLLTIHRISIPSAAGIRLSIYRGS